MKPFRVAFLGPLGTYTHEAALQFAARIQSHPPTSALLSSHGGTGDARNSPDSERNNNAPLLVPQETIPAVFAAVESEGSEFGVVPIENSTEGSVSFTMDELARVSKKYSSSTSATTEAGLRIVAEVALPIQHCFAVSPLSAASLAPSGAAQSGSKYAPLKRVYSHPQAIAQCKHWIAANVPGSVEVVPVASTAKAAAMANEEPGTAAICSPVAASLYDLHILERSIQDLQNNMTRFVLLSLQRLVVTAEGAPRVVVESAQPPSGAEPTSLQRRTFDAPSAASAPLGETTKHRTFVCFALPHRSGALCDVLIVLKKHGVNLSKIESRPDKETPWHYDFLIDLEGHFCEPRVSRALSELTCASLCIWLYVLGSSVL